VALLEKGHGVSVCISRSSCGDFVAAIPQRCTGADIEYLAALMVDRESPESVFVLWRVSCYFCLINIGILWLSLTGICTVTPLRFLVNTGFVIIVLKYKSKTCCTAG